MLHISYNSLISLEKLHVLVLLVLDRSMFLYFSFPDVKRQYWRGSCQKQEVANQNSEMVSPTPDACYLIPEFSILPSRQSHGKPD